MQFKTAIVPIVFAYIITGISLCLYRRMSFVFSKGQTLQKMLYTDCSWGEGVKRVSRKPSVREVRKVLSKY